MSGRTLILYVFHIYNERVNHFIKNCIFQDNYIDFMIISNCPDKLHVPSYVKILYRKNIGYDFGGWSEALLVNDVYKKYDKFILLNSSVIGPFIPSYYNGKWTDIYLNGLKDNIKLFGSTINTRGDPIHKSHVQSYIFAIDKCTLEYLIECEIFSLNNTANTFNEAILNKEIQMSRKIIENGWNIGSLLPQYKDVDFTFRTKKPEEYSIGFLDDIMYENYRNTLWNDYELVFIKGNRKNTREHYRQQRKQILLHILCVLLLYFLLNVIINT